MSCDKVVRTPVRLSFVAEVAICFLVSWCPGTLAAADEKPQPTIGELQALHRQACARLDDLAVTYLYSAPIDAQYLKARKIFAGDGTRPVQLPIQILRAKGRLQVRYPSHVNLHKFNGDYGLESNELVDWHFPRTSPTGQALLDEFLNCTVYDGAMSDAVPATAWRGQGSPEKSIGVVADEPVSKLANLVHWPAYVFPDAADRLVMHPVDVFFAYQVGELAVKGRETSDGHSVLRVEGTTIRPQPYIDPPAGHSISISESVVAYLDEANDYLPLTIEVYNEGLIDGKPVPSTRGKISEYRMLKASKQFGLPYPQESVLTHFAVDPNSPGYDKPFDFNQRLAWAEKGEADPAFELGLIPAKVERWELKTIEPAFIDLRSFAMTFPHNTVINNMRSGQVTVEGLSGAELDVRMGRTAKAPPDLAATPPSAGPSWRWYLLSFNIGALLLLLGAHLRNRLRATQ